MLSLHVLKTFFLYVCSSQFRKKTTLFLKKVKGVINLFSLLHRHILPFHFPVKSEHFNLHVITFLFQKNHCSLHYRGASNSLQFITFIMLLMSHVKIKWGFIIVISVHKMLLLFQKYINRHRTTFGDIS